jgi:adenylate cyclase, class 2
MDEVEIKFRLADAADLTRLGDALRALGASRGGAAHEANHLYADAAGQLAAQGAVLRLRVLDGGPAARLTFKGPARYDGAVKSRREIETAVEHADAMHALLEALGYRRSLTYEKERETWHLGKVEVALDELVFGVFCELEGPAEEITALAARLGLEESRAERAGYPSLMAEWSEKRKARSAE